MYKKLKNGCDKFLPGSKSALIIWLLFLISACGTVAPLHEIKGGWKKYNHKTDYAFEDKGNNHIYLNVIYGSFTYLDKSTEAVPVAKTQFRQVAKELAKQRGDYVPSFNEDEFYENTSYNGITGISKVLVSNDVYFRPAKSGIDSVESYEAKLNTLNEALKQGLLTQDEFNKKKGQLEPSTPKK